MGKHFVRGLIEALSALFIRSLIPVLAALVLFGGHARAATTDDTTNTDPLLELVTAVSDDVNATWDDVFARSGISYRSPNIHLVYGMQSVETACGTFQVGAGNSYCPMDRTVYLDGNELSTLGAQEGTLAVALTVADAINFHTLSILGIAAQDLALSQQAACLTGYWAWYAEQNGGIASAFESGTDFYLGYVTDGDLLAYAFQIGYLTDNLADCAGFDPSLTFA